MISLRVITWRWLLQTELNTQSTVPSHSTCPEGWGNQGLQGPNRYKGYTKDRAEEGIHAPQLTHDCSPMVGVSNLSNQAFSTQSHSAGQLPGIPSYESIAHILVRQKLMTFPTFHGLKLAPLSAPKEDILVKMTALIKVNHISR